jgi:hypothetical protein
VFDPKTIEIKRKPITVFNTPVQTIAKKIVIGCTGTQKTKMDLAGTVVHIP